MFVWLFFFFSLPYTIIVFQKSSICRSAIHAGVIKSEQGGYIDVMPVENRLYYSGSYQNTVSSERYTRITRDDFLITNPYGFTPVLYSSSSKIFIHIYDMITCVLIKDYSKEPSQSTLPIVSKNKCWFDVRNGSGFFIEV